jgi:hypothetical protein
MLTFALETSSMPSGPLVHQENFVFDYPDADVILRSRDLLQFRVKKLYIIDSSPILSRRVSTSSETHPNVTPNPADLGPVINTIPLPVLKLSDSGAILFSLLTFIFPVPPILPTTIEQTMELLSVAQTYEMDVVLTHIRNHIAQQDPPFIREDNALYVYSLAQTYGLRTEALQAAQSTLSLPPLSIDGLEDDIDMMSGACLHELWQYHERVKANLVSDLAEFRISQARRALGDSTCQSLTAARIPLWLDRYIEGIGKKPASFFDPTEYYRALEKHARGENRGRTNCTSCELMPRKQKRSFWTALTTVVNASITKAGH